MNAPIIPVESSPKTFGKETQDYIDSINQFLEQEGNLDINTELVLEDILEKLQEIVGYLP